MCIKPLLSNKDLKFLDASGNCGIKRKNIENLNVEKIYIDANDYWLQ